METKKSNVCGIVGISTGWAIPIVGIILGIISLSRGEPNKELGVLSIGVSVMFWILWILLMIA